MRFLYIFLFVALAAVAPAVSAAPTTPSIGAYDDTLHPAVALQVGHNEQVRVVAISPDGTLVASASDKFIVKIWDARTGEVLHTFEDTAMVLIEALAFSPDNNLLAIRSEGTWTDAVEGGLRLYSTRRGTLLHILPELSINKSLVFSPGGQQIATSVGGSIHLWNTQTGALDRTIEWNKKGKPFGIQTLGYSEDGKILYGIDTGDKTLQEWNSSTGELLRTLSLQIPDRVRDIRLSPNGRLLALGRTVDARRPLGPDNSEVIVCDTHSGKVLRTLPLQNASFSSLTFAPDNRTLAVLGLFFLIQFDTNTGELLSTLSGLPEGSSWLPPATSLKLNIIQLEEPDAPTCAVFSPDGRRLVTGTLSGGVLFWNNSRPAKPELQELQSWRRGRADDMGLSFSKDGHTVITESRTSAAELTKVQEWNMQTGTLTHTNIEKKSWWSRALFSPDGTIRIKRPDIPGNLPRPDLGSNAELQDAQTGALLRPLEDSEDSYSFVFIEHGKTIAGRMRKIIGRTGNYLRLWDIATGKVKQTISGNTTIYSNIAVSPDGTLLAYAAWGDVIEIWDLTRQPLQAPLCTLEPRVKSTYFSFLTFSPDNTTLVASGQKETLLYNARTGQLLHVLKGYKSTFDRAGGVIEDDRVAGFSPDGQRLVTCGDNTLKLWNPHSGRLLATLYGFPAESKMDSKTENQTTNTGTEEYLVVTPEGYYSGSAVADRYMRLRLGDTLYPAESFQARYYRPALVQKALAGEELPPIGSFKGPFPPVAKLGANTNTQTNNQVVGDSVTVILAATDDSDIKNAAFFINGARVNAKPLTSESRPLTAEARFLTAKGLASAKDLADAKGLTADSRPLTADSRTIPETHKVIKRYTVTLPVPPDAKILKVQAIAFDDDDLQSARDEILFMRAAPTSTIGKLRGLCVGVSQYQDARLNLKFADADANALAKTLGAQRGIYNEAEIIALTNENASAAKIKSQLDHIIAQTTRADTVIISLSGHGWREEERSFYFATYEVHRNNVARTALPWRDITDRLRLLSQKSKRVIVLLDACHSGSAATNEELVKATLSTNAGVLVFASSRGSEVSLENAEWGHGAFTKALIEAIEGKAIPPKETQITMIDFIAYVSRRVKSLTEGQQHPQVPFLQDFDTDTALAQIP